MRKRNELWRWTRQDIARELGKDSRTIGKRLAAAELDGAETFTTAQVFSAMVGDLTAERTREARERADKLALENAEKRKELQPAKEYIAHMAKCCETLKTTIIAAPNLEAEDKDKILLACQQALAGLLGGGRRSVADTQPAAAV